MLLAPPVPLETIVTTLANQDVKTALAKTENRAFLIRHAQRLWINLWDNRIELKIRIAGLAGSLVAAGAIYTITPLDWITNVVTTVLVPFLGPLALLLLADNVLVPILPGLYLFNKWADWYRKRRQIESM